MDVSILLSWKTSYDHVAWSAGYCPYCQQLEAVRVENAVEVVSVWFVPVERTVIGKAGRCDFCERRIERVISAQEIALAEWAPSNGLGTLVRKLAPTGDIQLPEDGSDKRLHSLLAAAKESSSINNVDITFGITTGIVVGIAAGIPLGLYLFDRGIVQAQLDKLGFVFASILTGVVGGAVVGAIVHALFTRDRVAFKKINGACTKYRLDTKKLEELSQGYGGLIRRAARAVRDSVGLARYDA